MSVSVLQVPPDAVESMVRQLVNHFVHDRARPEVAFGHVAVKNSFLSKK